MGYIKEPKGVDFIIQSKPLTDEEKKEISEIIAYYKATGKKMPLQKSVTKSRSTSTSRKKALV